MGPATVRWPWVIAAGAIVLAGWSLQSRAEKIGEAQAAKREARESYALLEAERERSAAIMASENALIDQYKAGRDSAVERAEKAERRRPAIIERVVERAGPDSAVVRAAVEEVADSIEVHELSPLKAALFAADSIGVARGRQLAGAQALNAALSSALEASRDEARSWEAAAKPKLLGIVHVEPLPAFVIGTVVGLALGLGGRF